MKKMQKRTGMGLLLSVIFLFLVVSCSPKASIPPPTGKTIDVKIANIAENQLLLTALETEELYLLSTDTLSIFDRKGHKVKPSALKNGMVITIAYEGAVLESYPLQLEQPKSIVIQKSADDLFQLYYTALNDLYGTDVGLNEDIHTIAFDLSQCSQLTTGEKSGLLYLFSQTYSMETLEGTYQQLVAQGYIDQEQLSFEDGILLTLSDIKEQGTTISFSMKKWRGGTGAVGQTDCKAILQNGAWVYETGNWWIS